MGRRLENGINCVTSEVDQDMLANWRRQATVRNQALSKKQLGFMLVRESLRRVLLDMKYGNLKSGWCSNKLHGLMGLVYGRITEEVG